MGQSPLIYEGLYKQLLRQVGGWRALYFLKVTVPFLFIFFFLTGCATYNAATGRNEFIFISTSEEVEMGKSAHQQLAKEYVFSNDAGKIARLNRIGRRIVQVSDRQDYQYRFFLIKKEDFNAFTTPGGNIYFFEGLFDKLNDDEVAFVLAHEVGHCAAKHVVKKYQAALGYQMIGSVVLNRIGSPGAQRIAAMSSGALMKLVFSAYGREDEFQADQLGVKYMYLASYDVRGAIDALEVLKQGSDGGSVPLILRTHPYLDDRIDQVREHIQQVKAEYH